MAAGAVARGHFLASDADREQVIDTLKDAFAQGRLTKDELGQRAGQALGSRTYAALAAITADIPARPLEVPPPLSLTRASASPQRRSRPDLVPARKSVTIKVIAWGACLILLPAGLGAAFLTYYGGFFVLFLFAVIGLVVTAEP